MGEKIFPFMPTWLKAYPILHEKEGDFFSFRQSLLFFPRTPLSLDVTVPTFFQ